MANTRMTRPRADVVLVSTLMLAVGLLLAQQAVPTAQFNTQGVTPPPGSNIHPKMMPSYAGVTVGPDRRLYAPTTDGRIFRFDINADDFLDLARKLGP